MNNKITFVQKKVCILFLFLLGITAIYAQNNNGTIDVAGDIAFVAYHNDDDGFSFLLLDNCTVNTLITFIDEEADNTGNFNGTSEGELVWTNTESNTIPKGTVIHVTDADDNSAGINATLGSIYENDEGTPDYVGFNTSTTNDQIYAVLGRRVDSPPNILAFVGSTAIGSLTHGLSGTGLTNGTTGHILSLTPVEGYYSGTTTFNGTLAEVTAAVNNSVNWTSFSSATFPGDVPNTFDGSAFAPPCVLDNASFSYATVAYCINGADPTPTITGLAGGTFSSTPSGLSINSSTGTIDVSGATPNIYSVTYTTTGTCPNSLDVSITIETLDNTVNNASCTLTANQTSATYQWYACPSTLLTGETNQSFSPSITGDYKVEITKGNCVIDSQCISITSLSLNTTEFKRNSNFSLYPNPSSDIIEIKCQIGGDFQIVNILGEIVKTLSIEPNIETSVNISNLKEGIYLVKSVRSKRTKKLIIKK